MTKTKYIAPHLRINLATARELTRNGTADHEVILMVADLDNSLGVVAYLETNGDPVAWDYETCLDISKLLNMDALEVARRIEDATGDTGEFAQAVRQALANR